MVASRSRGASSRNPSARWRLAARALALLLALHGANGNTDAPEASGGTYVDATETITTRAEDRFGRQPTHRSGQTLTRFDSNTAVLFGGLTPLGTANDVWEYKVDTGNWTLLHDGSTPADASSPAAPPPRVGHAAAAMRGDLWVFGGYDPSRGDSNDLWRFDRAEGKWHEVEISEDGVAPAPRSGHSAFAPDPDGGVGGMFVFGGNLRNDAWRFDVDAGAWEVVMTESAHTSGAGGGRGARGRAAVVAAAIVAVSVLA